MAKSREERDLLVNTPSISTALQDAAAARTCLFSLEDPSHPDSTLGLVGSHTEQDIAVLRDAGAACGLLSISFFDADGAPCAQRVSDRTVSITEEQFRASRVVSASRAAAPNTKRSPPPCASTRLDFIDVLITDAETAAHLIGDDSVLNQGAGAWAVQGRVRQGPTSVTARKWHVSPELPVRRARSAIPPRAAAIATAMTVLAAGAIAAYVQMHERRRYADTVPSRPAPLAGPVSSGQRHAVE